MSVQKVSVLEKVDCISDFHLQILMSDVLPMIATLFLPTKAPKVDVIVPYFVYSEPRPRWKQRVHALYHSACSPRVIFSSFFSEYMI